MGDGPTVYVRKPWMRAGYGNTRIAYAEQGREKQPTAKVGA